MIKTKPIWTFRNNVFVKAIFKNFKVKAILVKAYTKSAQNVLM